MFRWLANYVATLSLLVGIAVSSVTRTSSELDLVADFSTTRNIPELGIIGK
jgi:hypothetical protein